jgi:methylglutaconyl-CoA hydratase
MSTVKVESHAGVTRVTLDRAAVRNAFDDELIGELTAAFSHLPAGTRAVVLGGDGQSFCAGADLAWMKKSATYTEAENARDARRLAAMFQAVDRAPCAVVGRIHGAALGGGAGLAACCDVVVAETGTKFGFTEVRLGLVPAVISPFVMRRIGPARARRYFLTGELFGAEEALRIGLADEVAPHEGAEAVVERVVAAILRAGPRAVAAAKRLVRVVEADLGAASEYAADTIATLRVQPEAQEGMKAFLEKRDPAWTAGPRPG